MFRRTASRAAARAALAALLLAACGGDGGDADDDLCAAQSQPGVMVARRASAATPVVCGCTGGVSTGTHYADAEVEPWAAQHPTSAGHLLAAWQQDRWSNGGARALVSAFSLDGGQSWSRTLHPMSRCGGAAAGSAGDFERASDPWVDFGPDGVAHVMALASSGGVFAAGSANGMLASRSTDGGRSWTAPVALIRDGADFFNDKNSLTADATDRRFVYAVWDRLDRVNGGGPTYLARSVDAGLSWEPARPIYNPVPAGGAGGTSQTIGNRIVVLPGGAERGVLVNVFAQIDVVGGSTSTRVGVIRSADKGQNWSAPVFVGDLRSVGTTDAASGARIRDGNILPAVAAAPDGTLWVAWQDARFSGGSHDAIALARSDDGGRSWSAPVAINRQAGAPAFTPALSVRSDGMLGVLHFDLRANTPDPATLLAEAWLLSSRDGLNWTEARVAGPFDMAFAPNANGLFIGDYHGLVHDRNGFIPVLALPNADSANRTDVHAPHIDMVALARADGKPQAPAHAARPLAAAPGFDEARLQAAQQAALLRFLERRVPGWGRRMGARPAPDRQR